ncbi:MAG: LamG domain-containing protein [Chloroflexi bacterium]|nr:LamG domain-containing protein [Chloroflexota bacterium]
MNFVYDSSLVLYLPLYERDGASFMSADKHGHLCTVTGALWRPNGRYFDGIDDDIDCGNSSILDLTDAYTIEVWLSLRNKTGERDVLSKRPAANNGGYVLIFSNGSSAPVLYHYTSGWTGTVCDTEIALDRPTRISVTKKDTAVVYFLDGEQKNTVTLAGTPTITLANLMLGRYTQGGGGAFPGEIYEVQFYNNRVLTPLEIRQNYLATKWRYQ